MAETEDRWRDLGEFIRAQRQLHDLSLRQLAELARVSNPYLSQLERGMYRPSVDVLRNIASALRISAETMLSQAGLLQDRDGTPAADVESAIRLDRRLSTEQKEALLAVYRGFVGGGGAVPAAPPRRRSRPRTGTPAAAPRRSRKP
jgi:transcriptional regulator with XRE-family HTH domain